MDKITLIKEKLGLIDHPEGGYYKETYRSPIQIPVDALSSDYDGNRSVCTAIYFLLTANNFSAFHKVNSDEFWHFYDGDPIDLHIISPEGKYELVKIGRDYLNGEIPQYVVPGGYWFASEVAPEGSYSLAGCTVAPGFEFADFDLPSKEKMLEMFPEHSNIIDRLTR